MKSAAIFLLACSMQCMALSFLQHDERGDISVNVTTVKPSRSPFHKAAFLIGLSERSYSYLLGSTVWDGSWQWAEFATEDYLRHHGTPSETISLQQFKLTSKNGLSRIKCRLGRKSFLALKPVSKDSWQWAFFASPECLAKNPSYISHFRLIHNLDGSFSIQSEGEGSVPSFLAIDSSGKDYAFFATQSYLDSSEKNYCTSFLLELMPPI